MPASLRSQERGAWFAERGPNSGEFGYGGAAV